MKRVANAGARLVSSSLSSSYLDSNVVARRALHTTLPACKRKKTQPASNDETGTPSLSQRLAAMSSQNLQANTRQALSKREGEMEETLKAVGSMIMTRGDDAQKANATPTSKSAKRKAKKRKAAKSNANWAALEGIVGGGHTQPSPSRQGLGPGLVAEEWVDSWGEDKLVPHGSPSSRSSRAAPPHVHHPLPYTRRIEGLLENDSTPTLEDLPPPSDQKPIASLAHGLDRVLFNPGVHWMRDPRSKVYNFDPWLEEVPDVSDFAFDRITGFIKSSRDKDLWSLAKREGKQYAGSTSSLTGLLSHSYFLISEDKEVDTTTLSKHFSREPQNFTPGQRMPASILLKHRDGVYTIDSDKDDDFAEKNVLTWMGTMLERFLTLKPEEYKRLTRSAQNPDAETNDPRREAYRYAKSGKMVMRSQLDCADSRLPGTGVFDLKTRAAVPVRYDIINWEEHAGYLIRSLHGPMESFEKEYYDLIRSAFLKYSFQVRIGNMDGVLVAYHNTSRIFGFQYVPLEEMEERLYGGPGRGDLVFSRTVRLVEQVLAEVTQVYPGESVRLTLEKLEGTKTMHVWVEPVEAKEDDPARPSIVQLNIEVQNFVNQEPVRGSTAVNSDDKSWMVHYIIMRSSLSEREVRRKLSAAKDRQWRAYSMPTGVESLDAMEKWWHNMNYGSAPTPTGVIEPVEEDVQVSAEPAVPRDGELEAESSSSDAGLDAEAEAEVVVDALEEPSTPSPSPPSRRPFDPTRFTPPDARIEALRDISRRGAVELAREHEQGSEKVVWGGPAPPPVTVAEVAEAHAARLLASQARARAFETEEARSEDPNAVLAEDVVSPVQEVPEARSEDVKVAMALFDSSLTEELQEALGMEAGANEFEPYLGGLPPSATKDVRARMLEERSEAPEASVATTDTSNEAPSSSESRQPSGASDDPAPSSADGVHSKGESIA
ncbi:Pet127-domain-containing protein [Coniophora puteana RWD-64-598 SS2]|uniref:Pet127-domain-containing protein n=1 Tax=Coniophora puteana (strain RWD-64-598) TaxID=741705 RepID=A0A5M3MQU7_CONPW|nr:Pet127-domain-containing protein [Coniophora puteana RWD-64-598 SS2]EIW81437.1 Pet127-domain-containing protein [Coniophora puteana RWD-64-598 SS2]